jgi:hypothetical protein
MPFTNFSSAVCGTLIISPVSTKDTEVSSFTRISYRARELPVFLLAKFTCPFFMLQVRKARLAFLLQVSKKAQGGGE